LTNDLTVSTTAQNDFDSRNWASDVANSPTQDSSPPCDLTDLLIQQTIQSNLMIADHAIQALLSETVDDESSSTSTFYTIDAKRAEYYS
jgi:hypothetical protein